MVIAREEVDGAETDRGGHASAASASSSSSSPTSSASSRRVTIPIHQLEGSVRHGTWFDGSSIEGFTRIAESDQYLMPDMDTFAEIPWQTGGRARAARPGSSATCSRRAASRSPATRASCSAARSSGRGSSATS